MSQQLLYFVDDYDDSHLKKNVGVFLRFFKDNGYESALVTHHQPHISIKQSEFPVLIVPSWSIKSLRIYGMTWQVWRACVSKSCLLMGYAERGHIWLMLLLKYLTNSKVILKTDSCLLRIINQRKPINWRQRLLIVWPIQLANMVIVESPVAKDFLCTFLKISSRKIICLPNGIYPAEMDKAISAVPEKKKTIVYAGRLVRAKGADLAIAAFTLIQSQFPDWQLKVIGRSVDTDYMNQLRQMARENKSITFHNEMSKKDLWQQLAQSAVFLLTSREEGFSNTVPEAMYLKNVIVVTQVGENAFFKNDVTDTFMSSVEDKAIAEALRQAMQKYSVNGSEENRKFAVTQLNWAINLEPLKLFITVQ